jgi:hypothetical protein
MMASRTVSGNDAASDRKRLDLPALQHFDERRGRRRCKKLLPPGGRIVGDAPVLRNDTIEQRKTGKGPLEIIQLAAGHPQQSSTGCLQPLKRRIGRTIHLAVAGDRSVIVGGECQEIQSPSLQPSPERFPFTLTKKAHEPSAESALVSSLVVAFSNGKPVSTFPENALSEDDLINQE